MESLDLGKVLKTNYLEKEDKGKIGKVKTDKLLGVVEDEDDEKKKENDKD